MCFPLILFQKWYLSGKSNIQKFEPKPQFFSFIPMAGLFPPAPVFPSVFVLQITALIPHNFRITSALPAFSRILPHIFWGWSLGAFVWSFRLICIAKKRVEKARKSEKSRNAKVREKRGKAEKPNQIPAVTKKMRQRNKHGQRRKWSPVIFYSKGQIWVRRKWSKFLSKIIGGVFHLKIQLYICDLSQRRGEPKRYVTIDDSRRSLFILRGRVLMLRHEIIFCEWASPEW